MTDVQGAKQRVEELLYKLGFDVTVETEDSEGKTTLNINSPQHAILIGRGGETLRALQHIINTMQKRNGEDFVTLDIAGYRKGREEQLVVIAEEAAKQARTSESAVRLRPMNAYERRQVHMVLADMPDIVTMSEGEEPHRVIVVSMREA